MKRTPLVVALFLGVVAALPAQPPPRVFVEPVVRKDVSAGRTFVATVAPTRSTPIGSAVSGRVEIFYVEEGKRVEQGKPIAKIRTGIIEAEVAAARAARDARAAELKELENGSRKEDKEQAKARMESARVLKDFYTGVRRRTQALGMSVGREEAERALQDELRAQASYDEARAAHEMMEAGPRPEKIEFARAKFAEAEAEVRRLEEQLQRHTVFAPYDCYLLADRAEIGQWVLQGALIAEVVELDSVDVLASVLEDHIGRVRVGDPVRVEVPAVPDRQFDGVVHTIIPRGNERTRTFTVKVRVKNHTREDGTLLLKAGMFARATFSVGKSEDALLVHKDALVLGGERPTVYVVGEDNKVRPVGVELGVSDGSRIQVKGDLKPGERVIVEGNERVRPGQPVAPEERRTAPAVESLP